MLQDLSVRGTRLQCRDAIQAQKIDTGCQTTGRQRDTARSAATRRPGAEDPRVTSVDASTAAREGGDTSADETAGADVHVLSAGAMQDAAGSNSVTRRGRPEATDGWAGDGPQPADVLSAVLTRPICGRPEVWPAK